jgi:hypothetical protein
MSQKHSPNLRTILMVEKTLKNMPNSAMTIPELKRALPRKVNHNTLMQVLDYLEKKNDICIGINGITWLEPLNAALRKAMKEGMEL